MRYKAHETWHRESKSAVEKKKKIKLKMKFTQTKETVQEK